MSGYFDGLRGRRRLVLLGGAALAAATALFYCLFTNQVWEDYFITFKFSQNLCDGKGLVYYEGERVHGFTSPLGVLLPALCQWVTGGKTYEPALWLFRLLVCVPAFVGGGVLLTLAALEAGRRSVWPAALLGTLYAFESKSVAFSVNGMETALMLLFLAWTLYLLACGQGVKRRWLWLGVAWAGLMWTRPDSCVYVAASAVVALAFASDRRSVLLCLAKAGLVTTALYLPWFVWAWAYYGTPVPHTITAKGAELAAGGLLPRLWTALLGAQNAAILSFAPPYAALANCPPMVRTLCVACGVFGAFYWLLPSRDRLGRTASLLFLLLCVYLAFMPRAFPWYYPPAAAMGLVAVTRGVFAICGRLCPTPYTRRRIPIYTLLLLCVLFVCSFGMFAYQQRAQQRVVEDGNRRKIGEWLKGQVRPGERVYLECLGYIGYFSGARMLDWPGLCTPEVVQARKANPKLDYFTAPGQLRPEWMVVRFYEWFRMAREPYFARDYGLAAVFEIWRDLEAYRYIPYEERLHYDGFFLVFRRLDLGRPLQQVDLNQYLLDKHGYGLSDLLSPGRAAPARAAGR